MTTRLTKVIADFQTSLATILAVGATSGTLLSATDDDLVALPAGNYFFTIDGDNSNKEHIVCALSGTAITSIKSVSRQGVQTSGCVRVHRVSANVILTDWAIINEITNLLNGTTALDGSNPLIYDTDPSITDPKHLATKKYIDALALAGAPVATISTLGISKLSCAPVDPLSPIVVGNNDTRIPTAGEAAALAGSNGTPSGSNKFITASDPALNVVKLSGNQTVNGVKTFGSLPQLGADPSGSNDAARKAYIDGLVAASSGNVSHTDGAVTITIYYNKIGKTYFGFYCVSSQLQGNGFNLMMYNDTATVNKICALLGKTAASSVGWPSMDYSNQGNTVQIYWTGSAWSNKNANANPFSGSNSGTLISITVA